MEQALGEELNWRRFWLRGVILSTTSRKWYCYQESMYMKMAQELNGRMRQAGEREVQL